MHIPQWTVTAFLKLTRANRAYLDPAAARKRIAKRALLPQPIVPRFFPGKTQVRIKVNYSAGQYIYVLVPNDQQPRGAFVYVHGGGWVNQIALQHWQLAAEMATTTGRAVLLPIYPLIPFGTAAQVIPSIGRITLAAKEKFGEVALGGDSAGGQIALSAALEIRKTATMPIVLISPALDATFSNPHIPAAQQADPWLGVPGCKVFLEEWAASTPLTDPKVSPLLAPATELASLGPVTIFTGTADIFNPDAHLLAHKIAAEGGHYDLVEEPSGLHVYPLLPTRAGAAARAQICALMRTH